MKWMLVLAALAVLSGCATYSEVQRRAPLYTGHTDKSPQAYVECVLPKWMDSNALSHIVPDGRSRVLVMPTGGGASDLVALTLTATNDGNVAMRNSASLGKYSEQWKMAKSCL